MLPLVKALADVICTLRPMIANAHLPGEQYSGFDNAGHQHLLMVALAS